MGTQHSAAVRRGDSPPRPRAAAPPGGRTGQPPATPVREATAAPAPPASDATWAWWTGQTREFQVPWEKRAIVRRPPPAVLRLPAPEDPAPATGRMIGVCAWAALLAVVGLAVALRVLVALLAGSAPPWYEPTVIGAGLTGMALTTAAFLAVHRRRLPWLLLTAATAPLAVNLIITAAI